MGAKERAARHKIHQRIDELERKLAAIENRGLGRRELISWVVAAIGLLGTILGIVGKVHW